MIDPTAITAAIPAFNSVDLWTIGKLNHRPSQVDWATFGQEVESLCRKHGQVYYIKSDLRKAMERE